MSTMPAAFRLSFRFDADRLRQEFETHAAAGWREHYKGYHYSGDWGATALRSRSGAIDDLSSGPPGSTFQDTPLLDRSPYIKHQVLGALQCGLRRVRFMRLAAGSVIHEHIDSYSPTTDEIRLHVPIITNSKVDFIAEGKRAEMLPGECWFLDVNAPHSVANRGDQDRIHLVIDCEVDDRIRSVLPYPLPFGQLIWQVRHRFRAVRFLVRDSRTRASSEERTVVRIVAGKAVGKIRRLLRG